METNGNGSSCPRCHGLLVWDSYRASLEQLKCVTCAWRWDPVIDENRRHLTEVQMNPRNSVDIEPHHIFELIRDEGLNLPQIAERTGASLASVQYVYKRYVASKFMVG